MRDPDPFCICDPFADPDADDPACPNCHAHPNTGSSNTNALPVPDALRYAKPDPSPIADTAPDSGAERY